MVTGKMKDTFQSWEIHQDFKDFLKLQNSHEVEYF